AHAEFVNAVQKWVIENTRLGIPVIFHEEALHGLAAPRGTHFPVPIALASTWDPALVERVMSVAAREARARGCQQVLSPVVDLGRDPRWGRDRKSTRLNSSHVATSYAVFCLKKKTTRPTRTTWATPDAPPTQGA